MKRFLILSLLMAATISLTVQCTTVNASDKSYGMEAAPRDIAERNLKIKKSFSTVDVMNGVKIYYTVGNSNSVRIVGTEELVERTVVNVEKGTLKISLQRDKFARKESNGGVAVYVTAPAIRGVNMIVGSCFILNSAMSISDDFNVTGSSGAIFNAQKGLKCSTLGLETTSGCIVDISSLKATTAHVRASSGSIVSLKGSVTTLDARISSGAIANLEDLKAQEGSVKASSGAIANIREGSLSVSSSSGAIVHKK